MVFGAWWAVAACGSCIATATGSAEQALLPTGRRDPEKRGGMIHDGIRRLGESVAVSSRFSFFWSCGHRLRDVCVAPSNTLVVFAQVVGTALLRACSVSSGWEHPTVTVNIASRISF